MNKQLVSLLSIIVLVALGIWAFAAFSNEDVAEDVNNATTEVTENVQDELANSNENTDPLAAVLGTKEGTASFVITSLIFPDSTMVTNSDQTFTLNADGFDLAVLSNKTFEVTPGVYPKVKVDVAGTVLDDDNGLALQVTKLTPDFYTTDASGTATALDAPTQQKLAAGLQANGINIPVVNDAAPVRLPVTITTNTDNTFAIATTEKSPLFFRFDSK